MDFIGMFKQQPLVFIILFLAIIAYFFLDQKAKYGNRKTTKELEQMTHEERAEYKKQLKLEEEKRSKSKKTNLTRRYSNIYDERQYESAPKDGTSLYQKGISTVSHKNKKITSRAMERLPDYKHYLEEVMEKNLNHLARNMELINADCADDIYFLQKRGYFKDITIDETNCKVIYRTLGSNEDEEYNDFENVDSPYEILQKDFEGEHVPGINFTHVCPHCGTPNIIDSDTQEYNCYYCLDKVYVKGKNKK